MEESAFVTDAVGRKLELRPLTVLERYRLFKAIPSEDQSNPSRMGWNLSAVSVRSIDDVPVPMPDTLAAIEALIVKLDDAGMEAAQQFLVDQAKAIPEAAKN